MKGPMRTKSQFTETWSDRPFKHRGIKFLLEPSADDEEELLEFTNRLYKASTMISSRMFRNLKTGEIDRKTFRNASHADHICKPIMDELVNDLGLGFQRQRRSIALMINDAYKSFFSRNRKAPARPIYLNENKALRFQENVFKDMDPDKEKGFLQITIHGDGDKKYRKINVPYKVPKGMMETKHQLKPEIGGNLYRRNNQWIFMARSNVEFEWLYTPESSIGFDLNLAKRDFVVFSETVLIGGKNRKKYPQPEAAIKLQKKIKNLNEEIKADGMTTTQRRAVRRKWKRMHQRLLNFYWPFCREFVDYAKENKMLLSIDDISCGSKTGTFGQDKIVKTLVQICENEHVPFVLVPTPYTSQICCVCDQKGLREDDKFTCEICNEVRNSHVNAAITIAKRGWDIWENGIEKYEKIRQEIRNRPQ